MAANTYSPSIVLEIAAISRYLAQAEISLQAKLKGFTGSLVDPLLPTKIYLVEKAVSWKYAGDPTDTATLPFITNYLYSLCGKFARQAFNILGQSGTGIIINPTTGQPINAVWVTNSFTVGLSGAPVTAGQTSFVINDSNVAYDSVGFGFSNASPLPRTGTVPVSQPSYSVAYTTSNITITLSYAVATDEQYTLTYVRTTGGQVISGSGGGSVLPPTTGHEGQVLFTDGNNDQYWADVIIDVTNSDFEADGVTVNNTNMLHNQLDIYYNELGRFLDTTEFTRLVGGGFTITLAGFDANTQTVHLKVILRGFNS